MRDFAFVYLISALFNLTILSLIQVKDPEFKISETGKNFISFFPVVNLIFSCLSVCILLLGFIEWILQSIIDAAYRLW